MAERRHRSTRVSFEERQKRTVKRIAKLLISLAVCGGDGVLATLRRLTGRQRPARCVVIYYHSIPASQRRRFAWQMDWLIGVATPIAADYRGVLEPGRNYAVVSFDDAFVSIVENAIPELKTRGIPFTVFVPSAGLGQRPLWVRDPGSAAWQERAVSADELRTLAAEPLATIGSHTRGHRDLRAVGDDEAAIELRESNRELEAVIGRPVRLFSYPYGRASAALHRCAREAGYERVFTSEPGREFNGGDGFVSGRMPADPGDWRLEFALKLAGAYRWSDRWRT